MVGDFIEVRRSQRYGGWRYMGQDDIPDSVLLRLAKSGWWAGIRDRPEGDGAEIVIGAVPLKGEAVYTEVVSSGDWICFEHIDGIRESIHILPDDVVETVDAVATGSQMPRGGYQFHSIAGFNRSSGVSIVEGPDSMDIPHDDSNSMVIDSYGLSERVTQWVLRNSDGRYMVRFVPDGIELYRRVEVNRRDGSVASVIPHGSVLMFPSEKDQYPDGAVRVVTKGKMRVAEYGDKKK